MRKFPEKNLYLSPILTTRKRREREDRKWQIWRSLKEGREKIIGSSGNKDQLRLGAVSQRGKNRSKKIRTKNLRA